jgi:4-carboxymuconolactone decarboxylase
MRTLAATLLSLCLFAGAAAGQTPIEGDTMLKPEDARAVAPALEGYAQKFVIGDLWKRPRLSCRDRSIVTIAALIARDQTVELPYYLALALDSGVKPSEISEIITHLAFYTGWANAMDAIPATRDVFKSRNIGADQLRRRPR